MSDEYVAMLSATDASTTDDTADATQVPCKTKLATVTASVVVYNPATSDEEEKGKGADTTIQFCSMQWNCLNSNLVKRKPLFTGTNCSPPLYHALLAWEELLTNSKSSQVAVNKVPLKSSS